MVMVMTAGKAKLEAPSTGAVRCGVALAVHQGLLLDPPPQGATSLLSPLSLSLSLLGLFPLLPEAGHMDMGESITGSLWSIPPECSACDQEAKPQISQWIGCFLKCLCRMGLG